jgi:hypothetical protein
VHVFGHTSWLVPHINIRSAAGTLLSGASSIIYSAQFGRVKRRLIIIHFLNADFFKSNDDAWLSYSPEATQTHGQNLPAITEDHNGPVPAHDLAARGRLLHKNTIPGSWLPGMVARSGGRQY